MQHVDVLTSVDMALSQALARICQDAPHSR